MKIKVMPTTKLRKEMSSVLDKIEKEHDRVIVTEHGEAKGMLINFDDYNVFMERLEELEDIKDAIETTGEKTFDLREYIKARELK